ncbi:MAG: TMEM175 family protein [Methanobacterium sp.]
MVKSEDFDVYMPKNRLETLVDGIFAIAMTLLVLGLAVPHLTGQLSNTIIQESYYNLYPSFFAFVLSFILLATFWNSHHRIFNQIKMINSTLLWINLIWLIFIVIVPFSASSLGEYGSYIFPNVIFNLNMLIIALMLYINLNYALRKNLLNEEVDKTLINYSRRRNEAFILIALLGVVLSYIIPSWSSFVYVLLFPIYAAIKRFPILYK